MYLLAKIYVGKDNIWLYDLCSYGCCTKVSMCQIGSSDRTREGSTNERLGGDESVKE